jgi:uncharacterized membrane protein YgcG
MRYFDNNPKIVAALIYHWAAKWYIVIHETSIHDIFKTAFNSLLGSGLFTNLASNWYYLQRTDTEENDIDRALLDILFWGEKNISLSYTVTWFWEESLHQKIIRMLWHIASLSKNEWLYTYNRSGFLWHSPKLTRTWAEIVEHMRWYKQFIEKVEKSVLEVEIKNNPHYFSQLLSWATLFGIETRIVDLANELMIKVDRYTWDNIESLQLWSMISSINSISQSVTRPPSSSSDSSRGSSSSGSSGFSSSSSSSSSSWSSGGWGWGWGGSSW